MKCRLQTCDGKWFSFDLEFPHLLLFWRSLPGSRGARCVTWQQVGGGETAGMNHQEETDRQSEDIWSDLRPAAVNICTAGPWTHHHGSLSVSRCFPAGLRCEWCRTRSQCVSSCPRPPRTTTPPPRPASPPGCRAAGTPSASWKR